MIKILKYLVVTITLLSLGAIALYYRMTIPPTRVENPVITGVNYVGVTVSNIEQSSKLYHDSANLKLIQQKTISNNPVINTLVDRTNTQIQTRLMRSSNAQLRLMQFESPSKVAQNAEFIDANGPGIAHVCFQVNQKTQTYEKFLTGGATHIGARDMIQINPKNPVSYAYVRDHDNIMVEIEHVDIAALYLPSPPKNDYRIRHVSLATTDMERAIKFYSTLLETKNPRRVGSLLKLKGENVDKISGFKHGELEMAWFQIRNLELEIIQYTNPVPKTNTSQRPMDATGYNMIVFNVTNLALAKEKLLAAGGTIELENKTMEGAQVLLGRDLDGNLLGFQALSKDSPYSAKHFKDDGSH